VLSQHFVAEPAEIFRKLQQNTNTEKSGYCKGNNRSVIGLFKYKRSAPLPPAFAAESLRRCTPGHIRHGHKLCQPPRSFSGIVLSSWCLRMNECRPDGGFDGLPHRIACEIIARP